MIAVGDIRREDVIHLEGMEIIQSALLYLYLCRIILGFVDVEIVEFITGNRMNGVRLQLQIHKVIWDPEKRGV